MKKNTLSFKIQVLHTQAEALAQKQKLAYISVGFLCNFGGTTWTPTNCHYVKDSSGGIRDLVVHARFGHQRVSRRVITLKGFGASPRPGDDKGAATGKKKTQTNSSRHKGLWDGRLSPSNLGGLRPGFLREHNWSKESVMALGLSNMLS